MKLPTWLEANERIVNGTYTPIDLFVVNNEPAGKEAEEKFRHELEALLEYVSGLTSRAADVLITCAHCGNYHSVYIPCPSVTAQDAHR